MWLAGGGTAVLLWRREPLTFAALLNGDTTGADEKVDEAKDLGKVTITPSEVRHRIALNSFHARNSASAVWAGAQLARFKAAEPRGARWLFHLR